MRSLPAGRRESFHHSRRSTSYRTVSSSHVSVVVRLDTVNKTQRMPALCAAMALGLPLACIVRRDPGVMYRLSATALLGVYSAMAVDAQCTVRDEIDSWVHSV